MYTPKGIRRARRQQISASIVGNVAGLGLWDQAAFERRLSAPELELAVMVVVWVWVWVRGCGGVVGVRLCLHPRSLARCPSLPALRLSSISHSHSVCTREGGEGVSARFGYLSFSADPPFPPLFRVSVRLLVSTDSISLHPRRDARRPAALHL